MKTEILKSLYSAKHGCNLVLKRAKSSSSSVLSLVKSESGVETPEKNHMIVFPTGIL